MVIIIGLGVSSGDLTARAAEALRAATCVYLRTERHATAANLRKMGIVYHTFDAMYETAEDFDELYAAMAREIVVADERADSAEEKPGGALSRTVFCVPGAAAYGDASVKAVTMACEERHIGWEIIPGVGWEARAAAWAGGCEGLCIQTARETCVINPRRALVITEIDTRAVAGDVKLRLMEHYPDGYTVMLDGVPLPLYEIDRIKEYTIDTALFVPSLALMQARHYDFWHLLEIMDILRDPVNGCPWDREQTHQSLAKYLIEEAYEAEDAILNGDPMRIADELGDVLLQTAFHARIASEHGDFAAMDITSAICRKMISRHTHIFGGMRADTPEEVSRNWAEMKKGEKGLLTLKQALDEVPRGFPAALRAEKILKRLNAVDFDFNRQIAGPLEEAEKAQKALHAALDWLCDRVGGMENAAAQTGRKLENLTKKELSMLWKT